MKQSARSLVIKYSFSDGLIDFLNLQHKLQISWLKTKRAAKSLLLWGMAYNRAWEARGVVVHFSGYISIHDILKASVDYGQDRRFDNLLYVIDDYTQIQGCHARADEIEEVWAMDFGAKHSNLRIRKAIVTTSAEVVKLALYYKNNLGPAFSVEICANLADARAWLNV